MKSEIAVTRRAAYAAEGAVQNLEKEKLQQDLRWGEMCVKGGLHLLCAGERLPVLMIKT